MLQIPNYNEKFRNLQAERDSLRLQVQVLTEQIDAQANKINDLEKLLLETKQLLINNENMLQKVSLRNFMEMETLFFASNIIQYIIIIIYIIIFC